MEKQPSIIISKEQKAEIERMEIFEVFKKLLNKEPEYNYHDGSLGVSHNEDVIELVWTLEEGKEVAEGVQLEQAGRQKGSNYAYSQTIAYEAEPTGIQIAKIIAEKGKPEKIGYTRIDLENWAGSEDRSVDERKSAEFKFSEVETEVLKVVRALTPEYAKMSLEEIGKALKEKETSKE